MLVASALTTIACGGGGDNTGDAGPVTDGSVDAFVPPSCVITRLIEGRRVDPSAVAVFFTVDDCDGQPVTGLNAGNFDVLEDGQSLSVEAVPTFLRLDGLQVFTWIVLDMSSSTSGVVNELIGGARSLVNSLQDGSPVQIGVLLFAGESNITVWQQPTLDKATLLARLDDLNMFTPSDPSSTNLHGAIIDALSRSASAQQEFRARNYGGAFTAGYVVMFTDGKDTAALKSRTDVLMAKANSNDTIMSIALDTPDLDGAALGDFTDVGQLFIAPDAAELEATFGELATQIRGKIERTYLLGYCSPKRSGNHTVSVGVKDTTNQERATYEFSADGFGPGCTAEFFDQVCDGVECGGLGCGACDDRLAQCNQGTQLCDNFCVVQNKCGGEQITNPRGYTQSCNDIPESTDCGGTCRNLTNNNNNCGTCGNMCATGGSCNEASCECPLATPSTCDGRCVNTDTDEAHCGGCGTVCATGATCTAGSCVCPGVDGQDCGGTCRDVDSDLQNCGNCGSACNGVLCVTGICLQVQSIAAGTLHTCALLTDGTVRCWGANSSGQLGDSTTVGHAVPAPVPGLVGAVELVAGDSHTCARLSNGTVTCWGENDSSQLGEGTTMDRLVPTPVTGLTGVLQLAAGGKHTCALLGGGAVACWGANQFGQLGDGTNTTRSVPTNVLGLTDIQQIAAGFYHTCARLSGGTVACWGANSAGQLGDSTYTDRSVPTAATAVSGVIYLGLGYWHSCVVVSGGGVRCWGANQNGQAGGGAQTKPSATTITDVTNATKVEGGGAHSCALHSDGSASCWGQNTLGQLGTGGGSGGGAAQSVSGLSDGVQISLGRYHTCATHASGQASCWGSAAFGRLGTGSTSNELAPASVVW